jgi:hypothetical protein
MTMIDGDEKLYLLRIRSHILSSLAARIISIILTIASIWFF